MQCCDRCVKIETLQKLKTVNIFLNRNVLHDSDYDRTVNVNFS